MSSPGFSKKLSLSELYLLYKRVPPCSKLWRRRVEVLGIQREFKLSHELGEMVNDTAFELLRRSFELSNPRRRKVGPTSAIAFLSCTMFWVTVDAAASSL